MKRKVLITGGSRGLGAAIAKIYKYRNYEVWTPTRLELDLTSTGSVEALISSGRAQEVDILINNAGINIVNTVDSLTLAEIQSMLQINLLSTILLTQGIIKGMRRRKWGRVLLISSILSVVAREGRSAYSMSKAALNSLARSLTVEYGADNILTNSLCPGYVDTELTRKNNSIQQLETLVSNIPLRRLGQPEEIAKIAFCLASEENTYLTGQTIAVDGGFLAQ